MRFLFVEPVSWSSKPNSLLSMSRLLSVTSMPWLRIEPRLSKIDVRPEIDGAIGREMIASFVFLL